MQFDVLADQGNLDRLAAVLDAVQHMFPLGQIALLRRFLDAQLAKHDLGKSRFLQHDRRLVENRKSQVLDDAVLFDVAEQCDLAENGRIIHRTVAARHDDIRHDAEGLQLFDRMLGRFGLMLARRFQIRNQGYMDEEAVAASCLAGHLADGFQERLRLNIAGRSADLCDNDVRIGLFLHGIDK